jgi:hypothetical protein
VGADEIPGIAGKWPPPKEGRTLVSREGSVWCGAEVCVSLFLVAATSRKRNEAVDGSPGAKVAATVLEPGFRVSVV